MSIVKIASALIVFFFFNTTHSYTNTNSSPEQGFSLVSYIAGDGANNYLGASLSTAGDFNGDGINDLVIGANGAGENREGKVYIFFGRKFKKNLLASDADLIINGENSGDSFGWAVSFDSDFNNDGCTDLLVSAVSKDYGFEKTGAVYLFYGKKIKGEINASKADKKFFGVRGNHLFGWSLSSGGDINGDGNIDIVVGAAGNPRDLKKGMAGCVHIFFGKSFKDTLMADEADVIISGERKWDQLGNSVSIEGDVNGDGIDDLLTGAFLSSADFFRGGRAYLFYGKRKIKKYMDASDADLIMKADDFEEWVGNIVKIIPDINGDKLSDFIVSAPGKGNRQAPMGIVYIFYGGKRKGTIPASKGNLYLKGRQVGRKFGSYIAALGDVDGDAKVDLAVSEPGGRGSEKNPNLGSVYFFMTTLLKENTIERFAVTGPKPDTEFGNRISSADLDGDGVMEIIISAYYDDPSGEKSGAVFIYKFIVK